MAPPSEASQACAGLQLLAPQAPPAGTACSGTAASRRGANAAPSQPQREAPTPPPPLVKGREVAAVKGSRVSVVYVDAEDGRKVPYSGYVVRYDAQDGLLVQFDGKGPDDECWVDEDGEDEWSWAPEPPQAAPTSARGVLVSADGRRPSTTAGRKRAKRSGQSSRAR